MSIFLILMFLIMMFVTHVETERKWLHQEDSPNGKYTLAIQQVGEPFLFGANYVKVILYEKREKHSVKPYYSATFDAEIGSDGGTGCQRK